MQGSANMRVANTEIGGGGGGGGPSKLSLRDNF